MQSVSASVMQCISSLVALDLERKLTCLFCIWNNITVLPGAVSVGSIGAANLFSHLGMPGGCKPASPCQLCIASKSRIVCTLSVMHCSSSEYASADTALPSAFVVLPCTCYGWQWLLL